MSEVGDWEGDWLVRGDKVIWGEKDVVEG